MSFTLDMQNFISKTERDADKVFRGTALGMFSRIVTRTPVKTGRLRANWIPSINKQSNRTTKRTDKSGGLTITAINAVTGKGGVGDTLFLSNNLPYAQSIEDGSSKQAPAGMVKITVTELQREVDKQARKLR